MSHVLRQMLMSTSVAALMVSSGGTADAYAVNGFAPDTVADFSGTLNSGAEYYRVGGSDSTFDDMFTFGRTSDATMSALGWAPHNLVPQLSSWSSTSNTTLTGGQTDPDAGSNAVQFQHTSTSALLGHPDTLVLGELYVFDLKVKLNSGSGFLRLSAGDVDVWYDPSSSYARGTADTGFVSSTQTDLGSSWYRITLTIESQGASSGFYIFAASADGSTVETTSAVFHTYQVHAYRGSRVGMADDATSGGSYVSTTTTAVAPSDQAMIAWAPSNLLTYSEDLSNAAWTKENGTITANATTDPDGGATADLFAETTANSFHRARLDVTVAAVTYTAAVWLKPYGTRRYFGIRGGITGSNDQVGFDTTTETVTYTGSGYSNASIINVGDGWYLLQCDIAGSAGSTNIGVVSSDSSIGSSTIPSFVGSTSEGFYLWGIHLYRSDTLKVSPNPDRSGVGARYVPTTSAAIYQARRNSYQFNGSTYDKIGVTRESEARTNVFTQSQNFADAVWTTFPSNLGTTVLNAVGPDGAANSAATLVDDNGGGTGEVYMNGPSGLTVSTSTTYTLSIFAKASGVSHMAVYTRNFTTPGNVQTWFNLSTGAVGTTGTGHTARIENYGNGWYRCILTFTTDASDATGAFRIYPCEADNDLTVDRDGTSSILIYGAQFEAGSTASSYFPTEGATALRAAETLTIAGADMAASTSAMSFHMQGTINYGDEGAEAQQTFWRWQTDANNYLSVDLDTDGADTGEVNANQADGGTVDTVSSDTYSPGVNVAFNVASRHTNGAINLAVDGTAVTEDSTPSSLNDASSDTFELGYDMMGTIALFRQWDADLTDSGIESATS